MSLPSPIVTKPPQHSRYRLAWTCGVAWLAAAAVVVPAEWARWTDAQQHDTPIAQRLLTDWNLDSTPYFWLLLAAPICWFLANSRRLTAPATPQELNSSTDPSESAAQISWKQRVAGSVLVACAAWASSTWISSLPVDDKGTVHFGELPPAYHDEFSYLLQARTFLQGRWWLPPSAAVPELFDQVHVLNEGRFASRYFPGTGAWLTPFVAVDRPYWGQRMAGCIAAVCLFLAGCELGGFRIGLVAGLLTAVSPGIALFSNLILAHHPTLVGLGIFLAAMLRFMKTHTWGAALVAGIGLNFAMLCRPMTAAGFAFPFGVWMAWWLVLPRGTSWRTRSAAVAAMGIPLAAGFVVLAVQNQAITDNWRTSPYQQYTDIYTPRHVYGFNNVVRGEQRLGPKVLDNYDRWAQNLTPTLAARNVLDRLRASGQWTLGLVPLVMSVVAFCGLTLHEDSRWKWIAAAVVSLHVAHVPYWFVGIMEWHYVFETAPLLLLITSGATGSLVRAWRADGQTAMAVWWGCVLATALATAYLSVDFFVLSVATGAAALVASIAAWRKLLERRTVVALAVLSAASLGASLVWPSPLWPVSRLDAAVSQVAFSRNKYAAFRERVRQVAGERPTLVLVIPDPADRHIDYVTNERGLEESLTIGRYPQDKNIERIRRAFPERRIVVFDAASGALQTIQR
jgi:hypothetical protein